MIVVNLDERATLGGAGLTDSADDLEYVIASTPAAGWTALYDAVIEARGDWRTAARRRRC